MQKLQNINIKWLLIIATLAVLLMLLQSSLWGERGLWSLYSLEQSNQVLQGDNNTLQKRNDALARDIKDLKTGGGVLEEKAREDLGMVKRDESFFKIIEAASDEDKNSQSKDE